MVRLCSILAAVVLLQAQTSPLTEDVLLLSRIRRNALESLTSIPSYTCLETIERERRASARKPYRPLDVVQMEVAEIGKRELFAWPGQANFEDKNGQLLGLSSNGEFYAHLQTLMGGSAAIRSAGTADCEGRPCVRYDFRLGAAFANWTLANNGRTARVAESGSFWADAESATLYRLVVNAEDIPVDVGIRSADLDIRYGATSLNGSHAPSNGYSFSSNHLFQLPESFSIRLVLNSGEESQNTVSFTHCREYGAESKVVAEASADVNPAAPVEEVTLPAHLAVEIRLLTPVRSSANHVGDRIDAVVDRDVRNRGQLFLPRGAQVIGRVRRMEHYTEPYDYWIAALEFTDVFFTHGGTEAHARFTGDLQFYDTVPGLKQELASEKTEGVDFGNDGSIQKTRRVRLLARQLPGVGTFLLQGPSLTLAKGFHMTWITTALER